MTPFIAKPNNTRLQRGRIVTPTWQKPSRPTHKFLAVFYPEEEGGFSAFAQRYPGIVSQGETVDEAKANIKEAFVAMLAACRKRGKSLEFSNEPMIEVHAACQQAWITVDG
jgi:predicted RNase H-like HicB family nuclease